MKEAKMRYLKTTEQRTAYLGEIAKFIRDKLKTSVSIAVEAWSYEHKFTNKDDKPTVLINLWTDTNRRNIKFKTIKDLIDYANNLEST